jgi:predicted lipid carrier protein YhbT
MVTFLGDEWLDAYRAASARRPGSSAEGTVRVTVEKAPQGRVVWMETIEGGRIASVAAAGAKDPADVELTAPYPLALELWRDGFDPAVAFMQGRLKMNGDAALWLRLLPGLRDADYARALAELASATEF